MSHGSRSPFPFSSRPSPCLEATECRANDDDDVVEDCLLMWEPQLRIENTTEFRVPALATRMLVFFQ